MDVVLRWILNVQDGTRVGGWGTIQFSEVQIDLVQTKKGDIS